MGNASVRSSPETTPQAEALAVALQTVPVIGILRGCPPESVLGVAEVAITGGLTCLEVTLDSEGPMESVQALRNAFPAVVVGAGTVRDVAGVNAAADAGAQFVVSPVTSKSVLVAAQNRGLPCIPGAATPTEIAEALEMAAFAVKLFPADQLGGPEYLAAIMGPLGKPRLIPTGGVDVATAASYLEAGAYAIGVGGSIFSRRAMATRDLGPVATAVVELVGVLA